jgi:hypothetical protein
MPHVCHAALVQRTSMGAEVLTACFVWAALCGRGGCLGTMLCYKRCCLWLALIACIHCQAARLAGPAVQPPSADCNLQCCMLLAQQAAWWAWLQSPVVPPHRFCPGAVCCVLRCLFNVNCRYAGRRGCSSSGALHAAL